MKDNTRNNHVSTPSHRNKVWAPVYPFLHFSYLFETNRQKTGSARWFMPVIAATHEGGWGRRIAWTQEAEVAMSRDQTTALQPGWQSKTPSQKKRKRKKSSPGPIPPKTEQHSLATTIIIIWQEATYFKSIRQRLLRNGTFTDPKYLHTEYVLLTNGKGYNGQI